MPLFFQQHRNQEVQLGIWHITEAESFFSEQLPPLKFIAHPAKRLQHLAGRFLLQQLAPALSITNIEKTVAQKPFLPDGSFHFSVSHCGPYAAVIVSPNCTVGVDVELVTPKLQRVQAKFCSDREGVLLENAFGSQNENRLAALTILWSAKEALFKWYGLGGVDFKTHMPLHQINKSSTGFTSTYHFQKKEPRLITVESFFLNDLCCSVVATEAAMY